MRVLGIDPGLTLGYGVVEREAGRLRAVTLGVVRTDADLPVGDRLAALRRKLTALLGQHLPDAVALEKVFFNRNVRTAMTVGQASGVALATAAESGVTAAFYTPTEVKQSVVGYGAATKRQVGAMVAALLGLDAPPRPADAADAAALAITHLNRSGLARSIRQAL
jgi:crossover junction endodeoxyribonuclease RuvC